MRNDRVILFTDGSALRRGMGVGFLAHDGARLAYGCRPVAEALGDSNDAEAHALDTGLRMAAQVFPSARRFDVVTDSETTVRAVRGWTRAGGDRGGLIGRLLADLASSGIDLDMHWTAGHVDESTAYGYANAVVDRLARQGRLGRRILGDLAYGPGWARELRDSHAGLSGLPALVGKATAASWIGVDIPTVERLLRAGHLEAGDGGLVRVPSVGGVRAKAAETGVDVPDLATWSPGRLDPPAPAVQAIIAVSTFQSGDAAGAGGALSLSGEVSVAARPVTARACKVATFVDATNEMLSALCWSLPPMSTVRVAVANERLYRVIARLDTPPTPAARLALGRLAQTEADLRARLVVVHAGSHSGRIAALVARSERLALDAAAGRAMGLAPDSTAGPKAGAPQEPVVSRGFARA